MKYHAQRYFNFPKVISNNKKYRKNFLITK